MKSEDWKEDRAMEEQHPEGKDADADWGEDFEWEDSEEEPDSYEELEDSVQPRPGMILRKERPGEWDDEWEGDEGDEEEELEPLKPWMKVLLFLGLAVLAALICAGLWYIVHPVKPEEGGESLAAEATETPAPAPDLVMEPNGNLESDSPSESGEKPKPDLILEPTAKPEEEPAMETDSGSDSATDSASGTPQDEEEKEPVDGDIRMAFEDVKDSVTPKDVVNLRSLPSTQAAEAIVTQAKNGETLTRVGINENTGWSKIEYDGQTLYAVTAYLTTDLSYITPLKPSDSNRVSTISGRIIIFKDCDDWITPKEYVNLRTEPSTTEGDATVSCQLNGGERAHRTGYSTDSGWSRVEYDGKVLYVVTSLIYEAEAD